MWSLQILLQIIRYLVDIWVYILQLTITPFLICYVGTGIHSHPAFSCSLLPQRHSQVTFTCFFSQKGFHRERNVHHAGLRLTKYWVGGVKPFFKKNNRPILFNFLLPSRSLDANTQRESWKQTYKIVNIVVYLLLNQTNIKTKELPRWLSQEQKHPAQGSEWGNKIGVWLKKKKKKTCNGLITKGV